MNNGLTAGIAAGVLMTSLAVRMAHAAGIAETARDVRPLTVGDKIPGATIRTLNGTDAQLDKVLEGRRALLIVFRGGWCPFCSRHLADLQDVYPELRDLGYPVYALAPDTAESVGTMRSENDVEYTLLLDPGVEAIQALGLAFKVDDGTVARYKDYGFALPSPPGSTDKVLPVPAVYLVAEDGVIQFAHWETDYKKRLDPDEILAVAGGTLHAESLPYKDGEQTLKGYIAYDPSSKSRRPGVVVVHEWYGLNDYVKRRARQLAGMGYVAFAADMYGDGLVAANRSEAVKLAGKVRADRGLMRRRAAAALSVLKANERVAPGRTGAIGFCFGGGCVLELARSGADLAGVVSFHGNLDTANPESTEKPRASILVCHGAADPHVPMEQVDAFSREMHGCHADWQLNMYGGAVHAFTNPDAGDDPSTGAAYDDTAATRAWEDMKRFFEEVMVP